MRIGGLRIRFCAATPTPRLSMPRSIEVFVFWGIPSISSRFAFTSQNSALSKGAKLLNLIWKTAVRPSPSRWVVPACLPAFRPPACPPACLRARVPACLRACVPACLRACVPACLRACMHACMHACVSVLSADQETTGCKIFIRGRDIGAPPPRAIWQSRGPKSRTLRPQVLTRFLADATAVSPCGNGHAQALD